MSEQVTGPARLRALTSRNQILSPVTQDEFRQLAAAWEADRAALGRLQGEVETIINTEPHEDVCLIGRGGDCTCWQSRLERALAGETK